MPRPAPDAPAQVEGTTTVGLDVLGLLLDLPNGVVVADAEVDGGNLTLTLSGVAAELPAGDVVLDYAVDAFGHRTLNAIKRPQGTIPGVSGGVGAPNPPEGPPGAGTGVSTEAGPGPGPDDIAQVPGQGNTTKTKGRG